MPLRIPVIRAAKVDEAFVAQMKVLWKERWALLNHSIKTADPRFKQMKINEVAPAMSRLRLLCTDKIALDREITRLRALDYQRFYTLQRPDGIWLVGQTHPLVMSDDVRKYEAPSYTVYVPPSVIHQGTEAPFHFVPDGYELITARHPHHNVRTAPSSYEDPYDYSHVRHPLDYHPSTCWGQFGTVVSLCIQAGDFVDLFRDIAIYLPRINQYSLLTRPFEACFFLKDIGPADPPKPLTISEPAPAPRRRRR